MNNKITVQEIINDIESVSDVILSADAKPFCVSGLMQNCKYASRYMETEEIHKLMEWLKEGTE